MEYEGSDWGFNPAGTPLGGESSLSMPGPESLDTVGNPREAAYAQRKAFTRHVQRAYGQVNPHNAGLWDPRGREALSSQPADYIDTRGMPATRAAIKDFDAEADEIMRSGEPRGSLVRSRPRTNVNFQLLDSPASGLSPEAARSLGEALSAYDPGVVETIAVPNDISQKARFNNELGWVSENGGFETPELANAFGQAVATQKKPIQRVDENGVVDKYSPGTGPYDAPGASRPGGIGAARRGTMIRSAENMMVSPGMQQPSGLPQAELAQHQALQQSSQEQVFPESDPAPSVTAMDQMTGGAQTGSEMESAGGGMEVGHNINEGVVNFQDGAPQGGGSPEQQIIEESGNGWSTGKVIGVVGASLIGVLGLGMIWKGAQ